MDSTENKELAAIFFSQFESSNESVILIDRNLCVLAFNSAAKHQYGHIFTLKNAMAQILSEKEAMRVNSFFNEGQPLILIPENSEESISSLYFVHYCGDFALCMISTESVCGSDYIFESYIRNELTVMFCSVSALAQNLLQKPGYKEYLDCLMRSNYRILRTSMRVSSTKKILSSFDFDFEEIEPQKEIMFLVRTLSSMENKKNASVTYESNGSSSCTVRVNCEGFRRMLLSLISIMSHNVNVNGNIEVTSKIRLNDFFIKVTGHGSNIEFDENDEMILFAGILAESFGGAFFIRKAEDSFIFTVSVPVFSQNIKQ